MLTVQIISSLFFVAHYFLLSELLAGFVGVVEIIRLVSFFLLERKESLNTNKNRIILGIIFTIACSICAYFTWTGIYCILPLIATMVVNITLSLKSVFFYKLGAIIYTVLTIAFLFIIGSTFGAISQCVVLIFGLIGIILYFYQQKNKNLNN